MSEVDFCGICTCIHRDQLLAAGAAASSGQRSGSHLPFQSRKADRSVRLSSTSVHFFHKARPMHRYVASLRIFDLPSHLHFDSGRLRPIPSSDAPIPPKRSPCHLARRRTGYKTPQANRRERTPPLLNSQTHTGRPDTPAKQSRLPKHRPLPQPPSTGSSWAQMSPTYPPSTSSSSDTDAVPRGGRSGRSIAARDTGLGT